MCVRRYNRIITDCNQHLRLCMLGWMYGDSSMDKHDKLILLVRDPTGMTRTIQYNRAIT